MPCTPLGSFSANLQSVSLVEKDNRNFDEERLTGAVFLNVAKSLDTIWVKGLLYKLTNFPSCLWKPYPRCRKIQTSFQAATSTSSGIRPVVAREGLVFPVLFSPCVNDISTSSRHVELAQYADDTAFVATYCRPSLLVSYLKTYLSRLKHRLRDWRIANPRLKEHRCALCKDCETHPKPRPAQFLGKPIQWVGTGRYLGVTIDTQLTWVAHTNQVGKRGS
jgi:hypothetical protein